MAYARLLGTTELDGQKDEDKRAEPFYFWTLAVAFLSVLNFLLLDSKTPTTDWAYGLIVSGIVLIFVIDCSVNYYGTVTESRLWMLMGTIVIQAFVSAVHPLIMVDGATVDNSMANAVLAVLVVGVCVFFIPVLEPGFRFVRHLGGLRPRGKPEDATASAVISATDHAAYGTEAIGNRILDEVSRVMVVDFRTEPYWSEYRGKDILRREFRKTGVFFRIHDRMIEILFIPKDGVVCRFDRAESMVKETNLVLRKALQFDTPSSNEALQIQQDVKTLFERYSDRTIRFRRPELLKTSYWRRARVIPYISFVIAAAIALLFHSDISNWVNANTNAIVAVGTIGIFVGTVVLIFIEYLRMRRKQ